MPQVKVNNINIAYQSYGDKSQPTILLIHGLSTPLTGWPNSLVQSLVNQCFHVVLFDNRDVGKSEQLNHLTVPNLFWTAFKIKCGLNVQVPYTLDEMAQDAIGLLDALNIDKAHVVGASMGGMIAQLIAIHHAERILSLTSIMSTTGNRKLKIVKKRIQRKLMVKPKSDTFVDKLANHIEKWRLIQSPRYPASDAYLENYVGSMLHRGIYFRGMLRQLLAIISTANREASLGKLQIPTLVIHGDADVLVPIAGGEATAKVIPNAKLKVYTGMGHDLPEELLPDMVDVIVEHIKG